MAFIDICDSELRAHVVGFETNDLFVVLAADAGVLVSNVDVQLLGTLDDGLK